VRPVLVLRSGSAPMRVRLALSVLLIGGMLGCAPGGTAEATTPPAAQRPTPAGTPGPSSRAGAASPSGASASAPASVSTSASASASVVRPGAPAPQSTVRTPPRRRPPRIVLPPAASRFDYQLGGAYGPPAGTAIIERDRLSSPPRRTYGICYVNAFQTQPEELAWWRAHHPGVLLKGSSGYVEDPDWPGEVLLDTSTRAKRAELLAVVGSWIDGCARRGFKAVEPDNLDSWTRSSGRLTAATNTAFAALLTVRAHARGLAVAQKNTAELAPRGRKLGFDFAIAEECQVYSECDAYLAAYGSRVLEIEYTDNGLDAFTQACRARAHRVSIILRDRDLVAAGRPGYTYRAC
jgi:Glycoside-hydrolase family GH114